MAEHDLPEDEVSRLLSLTADRVGHSTPPDPAGLVSRAVRRDRARRTGAVAAVLLAVLAVVVPVGLIAANRDATPPRPADKAAPSPLGTAAALAAGRWENLPPAPLQGRLRPVTAWTGTQLLVWGGGRAGQPGTGAYSLPLRDGASYDPATRTWRTLPPAPFTDPANPVSAWTGDRWIVVAGREAASYDPATRTWRRLPDVPDDGFFTARQAVWAGGQLVVQGELDAVLYIPVLQAYSPGADSWRRLPGPPVSPGRRLVDIAVAARDDKVVAVTSTVDDSGVAPATPVSTLNLASGTWTEQPEVAGSDRGPFRASTLVATPDALYVPASQRPCVPDTSSCPGGVGPASRFVDGAWIALPSTQDNPVAYGTSTVWTGSALVALRNQAGPQVLEPASGTWTNLPTSPLPDASDAVWAGDRLIVLASRTNPAGGYRLAGAALLPSAPRPVEGAQPFVTLSVNGVEPTACGIDAPLTVYTAKPGAEQADTPEAAALRAILKTGIAGQSFPPKHDWVELKRNKDRVTYGARTGPVGIGSVVSVERKGGTWGFAGSGGCGPLGYGTTTASYVDTYTAEGSDLLLHWTGSSVPCYGDGNGADARVTETPNKIEVVLVLRPAKVSPGEACSGVGTSETTRVPLAAPVGDRTIVNVGYVPSQDVVSKTAYDAEQAAHAVAYEQGQAACEAVAAAGPGPVLSVLASYGNDPDHPMTVGVIRKALPDLPAGWAAQPADTAAVQCYLRHAPLVEGVAGDTNIDSIVVTPGLPPFFYDHTHPENGSYERLGDQHN